MEEVVEEQVEESFSQADLSLSFFSVFPVPRQPTSDTIARFRAT